MVALTMTMAIRASSDLQLSNDRIIDEFIKTTSLNVYYLIFELYFINR